MKLLLSAALALFLGACQAPSRAVEIQSWGELRTVLREGKTEGRVALAAAAEPELYGLGAVAGLRGEVLVNDGVVWVSCATAPDAVGPARQPEEGEEATILILAKVSEWATSELGAMASMVDLEAALRAAGEAAGYDTTKPFPFLIEGTAAGLSLHVLNGACPMASNNPDPERAPYVAELDHTQIALMGFYAENMAGVMTHHDSALHVHVLTTGSLPVVGHVDELQLVRGARLQVPRR
ncbi:MAG: hypothetical protein ABGY71_10380 [bacterium]|nr:hypothetical protein [Planctomycetota bacterium]HIL50755.1 hypothetical protein [Planctomycetota bacterium]